MTNGLESKENRGEDEDAEPGSSKASRTNNVTVNNNSAELSNSSPVRPHDEQEPSTTQMPSIKLG